MKLFDMVQLGFGNLRRSKLRTLLTTLGVVIGIGALTSMVSFGTGMQKNVTEMFEAHDLFTSLFVSSRSINAEHAMEGDVESIAEAVTDTAAAMTDSTLEVIAGLEGVEIAYPEITFPVKVRIDGEETRTTLRALPAAMGGHKPFNKITFGRFFAGDTSRSVVVEWSMLRRLNIVVEDPGDDAGPAEADTLDGKRVVPPDSILGKSIEVISASLDRQSILANPVKAILNPGRASFKESSTRFEICGVMKSSTAFSDRRMLSGVVVPMKTAAGIPRLGFSSVWELLGRGGGDDAYNSFYVRVGDVKYMTPVREAIEGMGLHVFSISDQLKEMRRAFLIMNSVLGAIGTIALIVAALGIINTMVMSILERRREIGIMKAIGGSEDEIRMVFFVEAAIIGVLGALFGLVLGWGATRVANLIVNTQMLPEGEPAVDFFYFPPWLIVGAILFSVVISLAAGLYPAFRAARVDPVEALRHD